MARHGSWREGADHSGAGGGPCRLVTGSVDKSVYADADFVIEAVFEEIGVKKQVFAELEEIVPAGTILATNTSSLSVTEMAAGLKHPERVIGFHFFNPVAVMPLIEIARTPRPLTSRSPRRSSWRPTCGRLRC